jgi:hypothetical protein
MAAHAELEEYKTRQAAGAARAADLEEREKQETAAAAHDVEVAAEVVEVAVVGAQPEPEVPTPTQIIGVPSPVVGGAFAVGGMAIPEVVHPTKHVIPRMVWAAGTTVPPSVAQAGKATVAWPKPGNATPTLRARDCAFEW